VTPFLRLHATLTAVEEVRVVAAILLVSVALYRGGCGQFESGPGVFGISTAVWTGGGPAVVDEDDSPKTPKKPTPNATVMTSKVTTTPPIKIRISFLGE
jgi:hypothetical protein